MKIQIIFMHMVQKPITIMAKPFFVLSFDIFVSVSAEILQFSQFVG